MGQERNRPLTEAEENKHKAGTPLEKIVITSCHFLIIEVTEVEGYPQGGVSLLLVNWNNSYKDWWRRCSDIAERGGML